MLEMTIHTKETHKHILIILNGIIGKNPPLSGGDIRPLEMAQYWEKEGYTIHILSSETAKQVCSHFDLHPVYHIMPNLGTEIGKFSYIIRAIQSSFFSLSDLKKIPFKYVYSSNDTLFDIIPAFRMKLSDKTITWIALTHIIPPFPPWKRKNGSIFNATLFFISERLSLLLAKLFADKIFAVSKGTFNQLKHMKIKKKDMYEVQCGVHYQDILQVARSVRTKMYDAVFMKRLEPSKGAFDLVDIWEHVVKKKHNATLLVLGAGNKKEVSRIQKDIEAKGLEKNIILKGHIQNMKEKIKYLAQSRVFIHPSYEENWAIVIGEAMAAGLPVMAYDLPELRSVWKKNIEYIPIGNKQSFSEKILYYLQNPNLGRQAKVKNQVFVKQFDWGKIAKEEMRLMNI